MEQTKIISPVLVKELKDNAGFTDEEIDLYMSFLNKKCLKKKEHFLSAGDISHAVGYVNKPFDPEEVLEIVKKTIG